MDQKYSIQITARVQIRVRVRVRIRARVSVFIAKWRLGKGKIPYTQRGQTDTT